MVDIHKVIGKIPFKPKKGFDLPKHRITGPFNPLHLQLDSKDNPYLERNHILLAIIYECIMTSAIEITIHGFDRNMLAELNALVPKGRREKVDRQLVRSIIGLKHRMGLGIHWTNQLANELHKPARGRFDKRTVLAKQVDDIWTAGLVDMSSFSRSNKDYKYLLTVIDLFSKYGWIVPVKTKTDKEVAQAFGNCSSTGHPSRLCTDKGTEFYNQQLKAVLTANNVMLYSTEKIERWERTVKNIMWKYFTANNTQKYI